MHARARPAAVLALTAACACIAPAHADATATSASAPGRIGSHPAWLTALSTSRADLSQRGVAVDGFVQLDASHVLAGGMPHALGLDAQRLIDLAVTIDTRRLLGWRGGTLFLDAQSHSGASVIPHQVPALADPDNMDAYAETSLDRAWFEQDWFAHRLRVQFGLMYVDDRFFTVPYAENFVSLDFSSDASISTFVLPTYPKGAWGADGFFNPTQHLSFSFGVYRDHQTELPYDPGGELIVSEEALRGRWAGRPVKLQLGGWVDTGRFRRFVGGVVHHAAGAYLVASGKLWTPAGHAHRGIAAFVQFGSAPAAVAAVRTHFGTGLVWTGPSARRPQDQFGIAYSDSVLTRRAGFAYGFESEIEAYYQFDATRGWTVQPDLEYWQHPGGGHTPDTVLGLIRVMFTF